MIVILFTLFNIFIILRLSFRHLVSEIHFIDEVEFQVHVSHHNIRQALFNTFFFFLLPFFPGFKIIVPFPFEHVLPFTVGLPKAPMKKKNTHTIIEVDYTKNSQNNYNRQSCLGFDTTKFLEKELIGLDVFNVHIETPQVHPFV